MYAGCILFLLVERMHTSYHKVYIQAIASLLSKSSGILFFLVWDSFPSFSIPWLLNLQFALGAYNRGCFLLMFFQMKSSNIHTTDRWAFFFSNEVMKKGIAYSVITCVKFLEVYKFY